jgi:hypothetical protein
MFIVATGTPGEAKNVICPAVSKFYVFRNDTTGGFALTLKTSGGTGIAVPAGQYKFLYCDDTNVVEMFNSAGALTLSGALSVGGTATFAANPTLSAGTANGVLYLNGSKVATSGSALVFDGSNLGLGVTPSAWSGKAIEVGSAGNAIWNLNQQNSSFTCNAYYDGAYKYGGTGLASSYQQAAGVHYWFTAPSGTAGNAISFTQALTLTSGGDLLVGTTSQPVGGVTTRLAVVQSAADYSQVINNTNASPYGLYIKHNTDSNGAGNPFIVAVGNATTRFAVRSDGGIENYSGNNVNLSDRREKTNFAPAKSYLDTICAIPVQTFNYIDQSEDDPGLTLGVVAQDIQAVAPELVMESNWGTAEEPKQRLSIYQTDLQYALMKCIQELKAQNDDLRARVAALES